MTKTGFPGLSKCHLGLILILRFAHASEALVWTDSTPANISARLDWMAVRGRASLPTGLFENTIFKALAIKGKKD